MRGGRHGGGFEKLGRIDAEDLGLPARQARRLSLEHGWLRAAGARIARHAQVTGVSRGVLEIAVDEAAWARELKTLLPRIVGSMARRCPELGIKRFRLTLGGERAAPLPVEHAAPDATEPLQDPPPDASTAQTSPEGSTGRLVDVARRYLKRAGYLSEGDAGGEE